MGGYKVQGRTAEKATQLLTDAKAVCEAGAFALTLECVPEQVAQQITEQVPALTIGIGAGRYTDGQVLVYQDMLGFTDSKTAKFVKKYTDLHSTMLEAFKAYKDDVEKRIFPADNQVYN